MVRFLRLPPAVLVALVLAGCAPGQVGMPPVNQPYSANPSPHAASFATELAGPDTYLRPLPTAVVLLQPFDMERNRAFCRAVTALPTVQQAEAASVVAPNLIHTRWLVQIGDIPASRAADCDFLTGTYDYARAGRLMGSIHLDAGSLNGRGPFLLMFIPDRAGMHVAGLDGSATPTEAMAGFVLGWGTALAQSQAQIAANPPEQPGVVRSVFQLIGAVLRTVAGGASGLITGVLNEV
jgi:hypothetical protein